MLSKEDREWFHYLIQKYLEGKASPGEKDFVESYYRHFENKEPGGVLAGPEQEAIEEAILNKLLGEMDVYAEGADGATRVRVVPFYRRRVVRMAAAAVVLLLAAGVYEYFGASDNKTAPVQAVKADVAPGGNKATLTLGNGQTIVLDSVSEGSVAQQGHSTVVKLSGGQLAYVAGKGGAGETLYNTLVTPIGGQYQITLPDGTKVWLNSASSIRYPTAFTGKERRVAITGEAYFEVKENVGQPFAVDAGNVSIQVLGTHFNVMAYSDEGSLNTTLVSGKVKLISGKDEVVLQPGEEGMVRNGAGGGSAGVGGGNVSGGGRGIEVTKTDADREIAWTTGFFEFDQTDLPTLMRQLKRWYGIEPVYEGNGGGRLFGGRINRNLNLSEVLNLLQGNGIRFSIEGKKLKVY